MDNQDNKNLPEWNQEDFDSLMPSADEAWKSMEQILDIEMPPNEPPPSSGGADNAGWGNGFWTLMLIAAIAIIGFLLFQNDERTNSQSKEAASKKDAQFDQHKYKNEQASSNTIEVINPSNDRGKLGEASKLPVDPTKNTNLVSAIKEKQDASNQSTHVGDNDEHSIMPNDLLHKSNESALSLNKKQAFNRDNNMSITTLSVNRQELLTADIIDKKIKPNISSNEKPQEKLATLKNLPTALDLKDDSIVAAKKLLDASLASKDKTTIEQQAKAGEIFHPEKRIDSNFNLAIIKPNQALQNTISSEKSIDDVSKKEDSSLQKTAIKDSRKLLHDKLMSYQINSLIKGLEYPDSIAGQVASQALSKQHKSRAVATPKIKEANQQLLWQFGIQLNPSLPLYNSNFYGYSIAGIKGNAIQNFTPGAFLSMRPLTKFKKTSAFQFNFDINPFYNQTFPNSFLQKMSDSTSAIIDSGRKSVIRAITEKNIIKTNSINMGFGFQYFVNTHLSIGLNLRGSFGSKALISAKADSTNYLESNGIQTIVSQIQKESFMQNKTTDNALFNRNQFWVMPEIAYQFKAWQFGLRGGWPLNPLSYNATTNRYPFQGNLFVRFNLNYRKK